jgi:hypothetical protein
MLLAYIQMGIVLGAPEIREIADEGTPGLKGSKPRPVDKYIDVPPC